MTGHDINFGASLRLLKTRLDPRAVEILMVLVERAGEVVEDREFFERFWSEAGSKSRQNVLNRQISNLRAALGDTRKRIIERDTKAGGYRLATEPRHLLQLGDRLLERDTKKIWKLGSAPMSERWIRLGAAAAIVLVLAFVLGFSAPRLHQALTGAGRPLLTLSCPPEIKSHEALIFGSLGLADHGPNGLEPDAAIVTYIHPEDGSESYFRQNLARIGDRVWWLNARFGNEEGRDMRMQLPHHFRVFSVYVSPASLAQELEASWFDPQVEAKSDEALIRRLRDAVEDQGTFAVSNICRVYRISARDCNAQTPEVLSPIRSGNNVSPVALQWLGDQPMYLELRRDTAVIEIHGAPATPVTNGVKLELEPGRYELKVSVERNFSCPAIVSFKVGGLRFSDPE